MKKILVLLLALIVAGSAYPKLNPMAKLMLSDGPKTASRAADDEDSQQVEYLPLLILCENEAVCSQLVDKGVIIYNMRDNILLASVPRESIDEVLGTAGILYVCSAGPQNLTMDVARAMTGIDDIHKGLVGSHGPAKGNGVIVGFTDIGFDAKHIAFQGRIGQIHDYKPRIGQHTSAVTAAEIAAWTTDDPENYHATHVGNIIAGAYMDSPYYGVAPEAEIVATTSDLSDTGILAGIEDIIAYGKDQGKPVVINISLGSTYGPHDGTDLENRYMSACAKDAVICISAGNNGISNCSAYAQLDENTNAHVGIKDRNTGTALNVQGLTDIWSGDSRGFDFRFEVYDVDTRAIVYTTDWFRSDDCVGADITQWFPDEWRTFFTGYILAASELCVFNNRYEMALSYSLQSDIRSDHGRWSKYKPAMAMRRNTAGDPQKLYIYADGNRSTLDQLPVYETETASVSNDATISNMAFADDVIVVGMYNSRTSGPLYPEGTVDWDLAVGEVVNHSSYSFTDWLPHLPHFCGPGNMIISALSKPYYELHPDVFQVNACSMVNEVPYYWTGMGGTSMSTPFVAGVMALWLQVNPELSAPELRRIAMETADLPDDDPRWGAGKINPDAGFMRVVTSTPSFVMEKPMVRVTVDRRIEVAVPGGIDSVDLVAVYNSAGLRMNAALPLPAGIYIVAVEGYTPVKIVVK